jgi:hypothetical protein
VVLGERLDSSLSEDAYQTIVYEKGALVLNALAQLVGERTFDDILRRLAQGSAGRPLSTAGFLATVERATGLDLAPFAAAFVYGTGVPEVEYSYRSQPSGGGRWRVAIDVVRTAPHRFVYHVVERANGALDVVRDVLDEELPPPAPLAVPFEVVLGASSAAARGVVRLGGPRSSVTIEAPGPPDPLTLDPDGILPAEFIDVTKTDKFVLARRGYQALTRDPAAAAARFRAALATPNDQPGVEEEIDRADGVILDLNAHLELARHALDRGADLEAEAAIAAATDELEKVEPSYRAELQSELLVVECRLALRRGDARRVARRLERAWSGGDLLDAEGLLLLAIAARDSRDFDLSARALAAAAKRRAEVSGLESVTLVPSAALDGATPRHRGGEPCPRPIESCSTRSAIRSRSSPSTAPIASTRSPAGCSPRSSTPSPRRSATSGWSASS